MSNVSLALKDLANGLLKALLIIALVFGAFLGFGVYRERIAVKEAKDFCAGVVVGAPADDLLERGRAAGAQAAFLKWNQDAYSKQRTLPVIFVGLPPFSLHICSIDATDVVVGVHYQHDD